MIDTPDDINDNKEDVIAHQNDIKASSKTSISYCATDSCKGEVKLAIGYIATMIQSFIKALTYNMLDLLVYMENTDNTDKKIEHRHTLVHMPNQWPS